MFGFGRKFDIKELERIYRSLTQSQRFEFGVVSTQVFEIFHQTVAVMNYGYLISSAVVQKKNGGTLELVNSQYRDLMNRSDYLNFFAINDLLHLNGMTETQRSQLRSLSLTTNTSLLGLLADESALWVMVGRNDLPLD